MDRRRERVHGGRPHATSSIPTRPERSPRWRALAVAPAVAVLLLTAACAIPDEPLALPETLPERALGLLRPDTVRSTTLEPGVTYRYAWSRKGPWAIHFVQADLRRRCDLGFEVLRAEARERGEAGRERVTSMVGRAPGRVLAAVNADFFTAEGRTVGPESSDGVVAATSERPAVAWRPGSEPWIGTTELAGDSLRMGWVVDVVVGDAATELVGGFPELLDGGVRVGDLEVSARPAFAATRHPRTAVGFDVDEGWLWLVVVDGRQSPHSEGMTLPELAELFEALGAEEALNLDGGGSTVMVVGEQAVSRPSDLTGERPVVNALALVQDPASCEPR